jgi:hypothetical protein
MDKRKSTITDDVISKILKNKVDENSKQVMLNEEQFYFQQKLLKTISYTLIFCGLILLFILFVVGNL